MVISWCYYKSIMLAEKKRIFRVDKEWTIFLKKQRDKVLQSSILYYTGFQRFKIIDFSV